MSKGRIPASWTSVLPSTAVLAAALLVAACGEAEQGQQLCVESYKEAWERHKSEVDVEVLRGVFRDLESPELDVRRRAWQQMVDVLGTDMGLPEPVAAMQLSDCVRDGGVDPELFDTYSQHLRYGEVVATLREYPDALQRAVLEMVPTLLEQPTRENRHRRWEAAMFLGAAAHPAFIEVLRAVVSNPEEEADVRVKALHSLALIPDGEIVDFLISLLHDGEEPKVAFHAKRLIRQLADAPALGKRGDTLKEIKREYEEWWQKRREEWKYDRSKLIGV